MADRRKPLAKTVPKRHFLSIVRGTPPLDLDTRHFTDACFMAGGKPLVVSGQAISMPKACPVKKTVWNSVRSIPHAAIHSIVRRLLKG